jgi:type I restriction enzyme, S subunit
MNVPSLRFPGFVGEWEEKTLGDLLDITSASRVHKDEWVDKGVPFFRSSDIVASYKGDENRKAYISEELFERLSNKSGRPKKNDLLVTGGGSIGIPYLIPTDEPLYFKDADLIWLKNLGKVDGFYLYSFFSTPIFREYVKSISHVGTISHYTIEQAKATPFNLPTLPEQQKIAAFLGVVDAKIAALRARVLGLQTYKRGLMQALFTQTLRFTQPDGTAFPDWQERRLGEVFDFSKGSGLSKADLSLDGQYKCIHYGQLFTEFAEVISKTTLRTNLSDCPIGQSGDILTPASDVTPDGLAKASTLRVSDVRLGGDIIVWRSKTKCVSEYFSYFIAANKKIIMEIVSGTTVKHIYAKDISKLMVPFPHPDEQAKIAAALSALDTKIAAVQGQVDRMQAFKKGLLQQMFV